MTRQQTALTGVAMEPGWTFSVEVDLIGTNPRHYPEPLEFRPDRFINADGAFEAGPGFVAFNVGPRACLGKNVALMEVSITVAKLLRSYRIEPVKPFEECMRWITKVTREF